MELVVIGLINHDTITMTNGQSFQSLGGILYNVTVLANLVDAETSILPVTKIGPDHHPTLVRLLNSYPNVRLDGIHRVAEGTAQNQIVYDRNGEKIERVVHRLSPLKWTQIVPFLGEHRPLLVNFISGFDLELATLQSIRRHSAGILYMDVHNLCLGIDETGRRYHAKPDDWQSWLAQADIVQMNEVEARLLADTAPGHPLDVTGLGHTILDIGPRILIITQGRQGSITIYKQQGGVTRRFVCASYPIAGVLDTTGCGDAFAAGFLHAYLKSDDPPAASRFANRVAAANCLLGGVQDIHKLKSLLPENRAGGKGGWLSCAF